MSKDESIFVCVSRMGLVVPTKEGGSVTLREGDEVEGEYYEQVASVMPGLMRKTQMSKEMLQSVESRKKARTPQAAAKRIADAMREGKGSVESILDAKRSGVLENFRGVIQDAKGAARNKEADTAANDSEKS